MALSSWQLLVLWLWTLWKTQNGRLLLDDSGWSQPRFISGSAASTADPLRFTSLALAFLSSRSASWSSRRERRPSSALAHLFAMLNISRAVQRSSCMASSSFILMSRTPSVSAEMMPRPTP